MLIHPPLHAGRSGARIEITMGSVIARNGLPQIVGAVWIFRAVVLLGIVTVAREKMVEQPGNQFVGQDYHG